jgi:hypothetical protein
MPGQLLLATLEPQALNKKPTKKKNMIAGLRTSRLFFNNLPPSRHRVVTAGVHRMTTADPFDSHPAPLKNAMFFNRLVAIVGTSGRESTACGQYPGKC